MKCKQCKKELEQVGNRERLFCNSACRMAYKRSKANIESEQIQSEHPKIQSEQVKANKHIDGTCYGCGETQPSNLIDICHECIGKGMTRESLNLRQIDVISLSDISGSDRESDIHHCQYGM